MDRIRGRFTSAHVIAVIALVVALGGTGYAALTLPKDSVGAKQIKKNAVNSAKVRNGSLRKGDFKKGQLPAGKQGPTGATGPTGPTGAFGAVTTQFKQGAEIPDGMSARVDVYCPAGERGIGGGVRGDREDSEATAVTSSRPAIAADNSEPPASGQSFTGWRATVANVPGGVTTGIQPEIWVVCAAP